MTRHRLEVADVFREHAHEYLAAHGATAAQRQVLRAVENCRTAALGGHVEACDRCGHQQIAYNSCRNRHCPKCQGPATARWLQSRVVELLPVAYFHLVFTLPSALGPLTLQNPRVVYNLLLHAAAQTLLEVAANPQHLGAEIGFLAVLHTWGQNLMHHPHVHCVIPAGGLAPDGSRWIGCGERFFLANSFRVCSRRSTAET
jgi:Transposase zinc-binding domain/Putative transposase